MFSPLEHLKILAGLVTQEFLTFVSKSRLSASLAEPGQEPKGISGPGQGFFLFFTTLYVEFLTYSLFSFIQAVFSTKSTIVDYVIHSSWAPNKKQS